jgi:DNA-binding PadR family transcriptional regulator
MRHRGTEGRSPESLLPLTPALYHFLLALADGDKHGYAVLKEVGRRTGGRVRLSAGTLYGIVKRALDEGLIEESDERPDPALDDERRRYYRLTAFGRRAARAHAERLEDEVRMARDKKLLPRLGRAR